MATGSSKVKTGSGKETLVHSQRDKLYQATRAYIAFLQALFASRPPGFLRWSPNDEETEILVTGQSPVNFEAPRKRPIISVVRGQATWNSTSASGIREQKFVNYDRTFSDTISSNMVINCLAKEAVEAQEIAWMVFTHCRVFKSLIQRHGRIYAVSNNLVLGQVSLPGALVQGSPVSEWRLVQVYSPFMVQETIQIKEAENSDFHILMRELTMTMETMNLKGSSSITQDVKVTE